MINLPLYVLFPVTRNDKKISTKIVFVQVDLLDIFVVIHACEWPLMTANNILLY